MLLFFTHRTAWRSAVIALVATQMVACGSVLDALPGAGSGKSQRTDLTPVQLSGTLSGVAKDGLIRNASVNVYTWNGAKGDLLGSGMTDDNGMYSLQLQTRSQPVLLEVSEGVYTEEATLTSVSVKPGQALYAVQNYTSGQSLTVAITYYSTLSTGLAEHLVRLGMKPPDAVEAANARLSQIIGVDTISIIPTDTLAPSNFSLPELQYGFATAALSSLTERASILNGDEPHRVFTSVTFIQSAYDDIRADGVLNGRGMNGEVAFGRIRLTSAIYRHELALHILRIANNGMANRTGRTPMQMFDLAKRLNDSTDPIFGGDPVIPIDEDKPNVSALTSREFPNLANNSVVFGGLSLTAMVAAFPGAGSAQLVLDDRVIGTAADPENPSVRLETFNPPIAEGRHTLKFRVTDISGAVGESPPLDVIVSNQRTAIENISIEGKFVGSPTLVTASIIDPARPQRVDFSVRPQGAAAFVPLDPLTENGTMEAAATFDPKPEFADGDATLKVEVTNSVGFTLAREVSFVLDRELPGVAISPIGAAQYFDNTTNRPCMPMQMANPAEPCRVYVRMPFDVVAQVTDNRAIERVTVAVDGNEVGQPFVSSGIATSASSMVTIDPIAAPPDGEKTITVTATDKALNMAEARQRIFFDTTGPKIFSVTPVPSIVDGIPVVFLLRDNISAQIEDTSGIASMQLRVNGAVIPISVVFAEGSQFTRATMELLFDTLILNFNSASSNVLSIEATDRAGNITTSSFLIGFLLDGNPVPDVGS